MEKTTQLFKIQQAYAKLKVNITIDKLDHVKEVREFLYGKWSEIDQKWLFTNLEDEEIKHNSNLDQCSPIFKIINNGILKDLLIQWRIYQDKVEKIVLPEIPTDQEIKEILKKQDKWTEEDLVKGFKDFLIDSNILKQMSLKVTDNIIIIKFFDRRVIIKKLSQELDDLLTQKYKANKEKKIANWSIIIKSLYKKANISQVQKVVVMNPSQGYSNRGRGGPYRGQGRGGYRGQSGPQRGFRAGFRGGRIIRGRGTRNPNTF